jgi:hypothetical protein
MRAATAIVGAIAVASILVALAFILSGGGSGQARVTKTVVERVEAPPGESAPEDAAHEGEAEFGGPTQCGTELSVENTTCDVGEQIHDDYVGGRRGDLFAKDVETGTTITMLCGEEAAPVTCTSEEGAVVYFEP